MIQLIYVILGSVITAPKTTSATSIILTDVFNKLRQTSYNMVNCVAVVWLDQSVIHACLSQQSDQKHLCNVWLNPHPSLHKLTFLLKINFKSESALQSNIYITKTACEGNKPNLVQIEENIK